MKKILYLSFLAGISLIAFTVNAQHSAADTTALRTIQNTNFRGTTALNWDTEANPSNWIGVSWDTTLTPYRVIELDLANGSSPNGGSNGGGNGAGGGKQPTSYSVSTYSSFATGTVTDLKGSLDFTAFTELKRLFLNQNDSVTGADVSGLMNLEHFYFGQTSIETADLSGLTGLLMVRANSDSLTTLDVSGCTSLVRLKCSWRDEKLTSLNITGCANLEQLTLKNSGLTTLDVSGLPELLRLATSRSSSFETITGLANCTKLEGLSIARSIMATDVDVTANTSLARLGARDNMITSFPGLIANLSYKTNVSNNRLELTEAAQIHNLAVSNNANANPQGPSYWPADIIYTDSLDFSAEDSVDVGAGNVSSTFELFNDAGASQGTNTTGIFNFLQADTGCYYVELSNSNVTVSTDTFCVLNSAAIAAVTIDNANFGTVTVGNTATQTLTIANSGNIDLDVTAITAPSGYTLASTTATVASGASTDITVTFTPTATQAYNGDITVTSNNSAGPTNLVAITGMGMMVVDSTIGILENGEQILEFYPNPTNGVMFIKDNTKNFRTLYLYNGTGMLVREISVVNQTGKIDFGTLPTGTYVIRSQDGTVKQKLIRY